MRKNKIITATVLALTISSTLSTTAFAATLNSCNIPTSSNNVRVISNLGNTGSLQSQLKNLTNCYTNISIPQLNDCFKDLQPNKNNNNNNIVICPPTIELPDTNTPGAGKPDIKNPDTETPDIETPDVETPDVETPDVETPDVEIPDTDKPSTEKPGVETPGSNENQNKENLTYAEQVVELVNEERAKYGLSALTLEKDLQSAALVRAKEIQTSFSHTRPSGKSYYTAIQEQGYSYRGSGENIAYGQKTPAAVMQAWMNSSGHRANILNSSYTSIGVGYLQNGGTNYWVQLFAY